MLFKIDGFVAPDGSISAVPSKANPAAASAGSLTCATLATETQAIDAPLGTTVAKFMSKLIIELGSERHPTTATSHDGGILGCGAFVFGCAVLIGDATGDIDDTLKGDGDFARLTMAGFVGEGGGLVGISWPAAAADKQSAAYD
jgi:hypothetical protein